MGRLSRFLMLERARRSEPTDPPSGTPRVAERFEGVRPEVASPPVTVDPFAPPPQSDAPIDVTSPDDERPSTRCIVCGVENGRFATGCGGCNAPLRTAAVVRANRRLWQDERTGVLSGRAAKSAAASDEVAAMAEERRARGVAEVDAAFTRIVDEERARQREGAWVPYTVGAIVVVVLATVFWLKDVFDLDRRGRGYGHTSWLTEVLITGAVIGLALLFGRRRRR